MSNQFKMLKKLSVKTVYGKVSVRDIPKGGSIPIMTVFGRAMAAKPIQTPLGDSLAFHGDFRAIANSGERFCAMVCYLPPVAANYLGAALQEGKAVEFAFKVSASDNPQSPVGYEYTCEPVNVSESGADPLAHLVERLTGAPALPAPAEQPTEAPAGKTPAKKRR